jgi:hypothetical protein
MIGWLTLGCFVGFGVAKVLFLFQKQTPPKIVEVVKEDRTKIEELQSQAAQEMQRLGKKLQEAAEKTESYKKLIEVHQFENGKLRNEKQQGSDELLAKTRRLAELELYLEEPAALPIGDRKHEFLYNQMKLQFEEKDVMLQQVRASLLAAEDRLKELEEKTSEPTPTELTLSQQLTELANEKDKLESELTSVQELVTELSQKKVSSKSKKKKTG